jgi:2'-5' RNA ligase
LWLIFFDFLCRIKVMSHRTFIALDIDSAARRRLAALRDVIRCQAGRSDKINWVAAENFHITLKFLGDVDDAQLADVCNTVKVVAAGTPPFDFTIGKVAAIPPAGRALRMFWADVEETDTRMTNLFASLETALQPLGFPRETRPFAKHITLARVKYVRSADTLRVAAASLGREEPSRVFADHVTVYTSTLQPAGPIYTPAATAPLAG